MKVELVAIGLAKRVFQVCAIGMDGKPLFNRKLSREKFIAWLKDLLLAIRDRHNPGISEAFRNRHHSPSENWACPGSSQLHLFVVPHRLA